MHAVLLAVKSNVAGASAALRPSGVSYLWVFLCLHDHLWVSHLRQHRHINGTHGTAGPCLPEALQQQQQ
jgi:hypothetical protein